MKKFLLFAALAAFSFLCVAEEAKPQDPPAAKTCEAASCGEDGAKDEGMDFRLSRIARGLTNAITCPLEMPRNMILGNSQVPFWGFVAGTVNGVGYTAMRAFTGVTDVLFFGFDAGTAYDDDFREFVWESRWQYSKAKK